ncbi:MAG: hypothetical protein ACQETR_13495 [Thermodesulfobacteriota bacterium]
MKKSSICRPISIAYGNRGGIKLQIIDRQSDLLFIEMLSENKLSHDVRALFMGYRPEKHGADRPSGLCVIKHDHTKAHMRILVSYLLKVETPPCDATKFKGYRSTTVC